MALVVMLVCGEGSVGLIAVVVVCAGRMGLDSREGKGGGGGGGLARW